MMQLSESNAKNVQLIAARKTAFNAIEGPRVGDFLILGEEEYRRFTYDWGDSLQTTPARYASHYSASFYMCSSGHADFSGSLDPSIPKSEFILTDETKLGTFWMFHEGIPGAGRGVNFQLACRVFKRVVPC